MEKGSPQGRKYKRSFWKNFLFYGVIIFTIMLVIAGFWLSSIWEQVYEAVAPGKGENIFPRDKEREPLPDILNVLVLGLDSRDQVCRADTIMLLTLNNKTGSINIIPFRYACPYPGLWVGQNQPCLCFW